MKKQKSRNYQGGTYLNILLFLAKGFETMEASVFVDVMGAKNVD